MRKMMMKIMRFFFYFSILMEHRWNETDRGKPKYSGKNLSQCHFAHTNTKWIEPGSNPGLRHEKTAQLCSVERCHDCESEITRNVDGNVMRNVPLKQENKTVFRVEIRTRDLLNRKQARLSISI
jgi:hypothetical protein